MIQARHKIVSPIIIKLLLFLSLYPSETEALKDKTTTQTDSSSSSSIVLLANLIFSSFFFAFTCFFFDGSTDQVDSPLLLFSLGLPYAGFLSERRMKIFNVRGCFGSKTRMRLNLVLRRHHVG